MNAEDVFVQAVFRKHLARRGEAAAILAVHGQAAGEENLTCDLVCWKAGKSITELRICRG